MADLNDVFAHHRPPPGGLNGLRTRLDAPRRSWAWLSTVVVLAIALVVVSIPHREPGPGLAMDAGALWLTDTPSQVVTVLPGAEASMAVRAVVHDQGVHVYRVASLRAPSIEGASPRPDGR